MSDEASPPSESLLPYEAWTEAAMRQVMLRALAHVAAHGLPGEHHFYISFRTDHPGVVIPARLRAQYPQEMTIVLQHQFWDLTMDEASGLLSVGLSFGGVPSTLVIPLAAVTGFADPLVRFGLRFTPEGIAPPAAADDAPAAEAEAADGETGTDAAPPAPAPQVVSLDAFRRRSPPKP
ncbi:MAG: hypothetical protein KGL52_13280 [Rhodospirillales bacterium]|jgi:hypothetical protein|nr:hypothetical protein [Rhodospirillales bacterium]